MIAIFTVVTLLFSACRSLHLQYRPIHQSLSSTDLTVLINNANHNLSEIKSTLKSTTDSLNPFNQEDRISKLEANINQARQSLINIYWQTGISLNNFTYYYLQLTPEQISAINANIDSIKQNLDTLTQTPPLNEPTHPNKQTTQQLNYTVNTIKFGLTDKSGIATAAAPIQIAQTNLPASNSWSLGGATLNTIANSFKVGKFQNGETCPPEKPFANNLNQCIGCSGYFDLGTKNCMSCKNFDTVKHICLDSTGQTAAPTTPTTPTTPSTTPTTPSPTTPTAPPSTTPPSTTPPSTTQPSTTPTTPPSTAPTTPSTPSTVPNTPTTPTTPAQPVQRMTNLQNAAGILLPSNKMFSDYSKQLSSKSGSAVPCPAQSPFFDGTKCLSCPSGQYFSVEINGCQTCPTGFVYSNASYHCEKINFYSTLKDNDRWISVSKSPTQIQQEINQTLSLPYSMACPQNQPFFNGKECLSCQEPTPYFSFDSKQCSSCTAGTVFSSNLHICLIGQRAQTNLNSPNLLLDGHPLNQWKYFYFNNQTADPQLGDCPPNRPYYDGTACVSCSAPTPLFSLSQKKCTSCATGTSYDSTSRECLSSSGNIVTQNPTLAKMAAGIFA